MRVRLLPGQVGEEGEGGEGGGAGADDRRALAGVAGSDGRVGEVGDAVGDAVGRLPLAEGGEAVGAHRAGGGPGAGGVDDGAGGDPLLAAVGRLEVHGEGLVRAAGVDDAVTAGPGHAGDGGAVADLVAEGVGERLEVPLGPVAAGRVRRAIGARPAGRGQQLLGGGVGDLGPGREEADVRPVPYGRRGRRAGLQHQRFDTALHEVGGGGQTDRAGSDDHDGRVLLLHGGASFDLRSVARPGGGGGGSADTGRAGAVGQGLFSVVDSTFIDGLWRQHGACFDGRQDRHSSK